MFQQWCQGSGYYSIFAVGRQEGSGCQILGQGRFSAAAAAVLYGKMLHVLCSSGGMGWKAWRYHLYSTSFPVTFLGEDPFSASVMQCHQNLGRTGDLTCQWIDCLLYLVKHVLTNEEILFSLPVTLHISVCCVWAKNHIAKACHKNEMARCRFLGKKIPGIF